MASYKVIFLGLSVIGLEEEGRLLGGLQKRFHLTPAKAEGLLQKVPVVVKKGLSKEEAERFVKVFDEIGGRANVEEEIPTLEITQDHEPKPGPEPTPVPRSEPKPAPRSPEPERRAYKVEMVTCPQCGFEQPQTDECVKCGIIISKYVQFQEMARSVEGQVREISAKEYPPTPWESEGGFVGAFLKTTQEVLFSPTKFFRKTAAGKGYWSPFIFAMIVGVIGSGVSLFWQWLFFSGSIPPQILSVTTYGVLLTSAIISIPFTIAFSVFVGSGVTHLCLMIVRGNRKGFEATFRAICYSQSALLIYMIPFIYMVPFVGTFLGALAGGVYLMILAILGVREGHEISTGRAVLAILLPLIVVTGLGILLAIMIPLFIGSLGFHSGVRA